MTSLTEPSLQVVGGVDTHKDVHVAAAIDTTGRMLGTVSFPTTSAGYRALLGWLRGHGTVVRVGIEGTGCWGAGITRFVTDAKIPVVEVDRPNRQRRRRHGKSDPTDAEAAARAALAHDATTIPKSRDGNVEMIRALRVARRSAIKARTQAANQLHALVVNAPDTLRAQLRTLNTNQLIEHAANFRAGSMTTPAAAIKLALHEIARRHRHLSGEIIRLDAHLDELVKATAPQLVARRGVGTDTAGALLVATGDNPHRLANERSFAALCGASPRDASSGKQQRHRLNRGGDRQANHALWRIVMVRMSCDPATKAYIARRRAEGKTTREAIRCLKRYVAREIYQALHLTP
ncbi:MAG TPA: IS110 family transposase [Acidimicrobiia bacterium]|nr:IS110 family transposase [Acidimicrobiia bacterium]